AERLCEAHEIWIYQIHSFAPSCVLGILQGGDAGQASIVYYDSDYINPILNRSREFLTRHQETAVAANRHHLTVRKCHLGAERRRKGVPHRNEGCGMHESPRLIYRELADESIAATGDVSRNDGIAIQDFAQVPPVHRRTAGRSDI